MLRDSGLLFGATLNNTAADRELFWNLVTFRHCIADAVSYNVKCSASG